MLKSIFNAGSKSDTEHVSSFDDLAVTWQQLETMLAQNEERYGCQPEDLDTGAPSSKATVRTFGHPVDSIRIRLFRDSAAWCPYCQKVWLLLEEKQIPYTIEKINMRCYGAKPAHFMAKVPGGLLPVVEIDGHVLTESDAIMGALEQLYPEPAMLPHEGTPRRELAERLMQLERQHFSTWLQWLCSPVAHKAARERYVKCLDAVDQALQGSGGPFFLGEELSMVDCVFAPFLERAAASLAYYKGYYVRGTGAHAAVERWFSAMEQRPAYLATRSDFYTHCHDLPPQLGGCSMHCDGESVAAVIDGTSAGAWRLPLGRLGAESLPEPYSPGDDPPRDRTIAAQALVRNHGAISKFAARGAGSAGRPAVSAALSDPNAKPRSEAVPHVDMALRHIAHALLVGADTKQGSEHKLQAADGSNGAESVHCGAQGSEQAVASLRYLADRIGVPRDLPFPAARQLRAHIGWFIECVSDAQGEPASDGQEAL